MTHKLKKLSALLCVFAFGSALSAATLVSWDFDPLTGGSGNFGPSPFTGTSLTNTTSSGLIRGSAVLATGSGAANAWGSNDFIIASPSFANAVTAGDFATFTVAASPGYEVSISGFSAYNIRRSASGPSTGQWQYSLNGTTFTDIGSTITWGAVTTASGNAQSAIDLSGISALQSFGGTITFRIVTWGATTTGGTWYLNDPAGSVGADFSVLGTVALAAVPEPSTYAAILGGVALMSVVAGRRRRSAVAA